MKPIEERVKNIVENSELLRITEKSEIICLIECYKGADQLAQQTAKENEKLKTAINTAIDIIKDEPDLFYLFQILKTGINEN